MQFFTTFRVYNGHGKIKTHSIVKSIIIVRREEESAKYLKFGQW